jgi:hypothetical protein
LLASQLNAITELPSSTKSANYTLTASDAGTTVIGNGTSITFTVNNSVYSAAQVVQITNINSTTLTVAAGAGVTINAAAGLTLAQYQTAQLYAVSASSFVLAKTAVTASAGALTRIGGGSLSGASTSFTNAFSTTYQTYIVTMTNTTATNNSSLLVKLGSATTGYYAARPWTAYSAATADFANTNNGSSFDSVGYVSANTSAAFMIFMNPFEAVRTHLYVACAAPVPGSSAGFASGFHNANTSFTDFTLAPETGTFTSGTVNIYGLALS